MKFSEYINKTIIAEHNYSVTVPDCTSYYMYVDDAHKQTLETGRNLVCVRYFHALQYKSVSVRASHANLSDSISKVFGHSLVYPTCLVWSVANIYKTQWTSRLRTVEKFFIFVALALGVIANRPYFIEDVAFFYI